MITEMSEHFDESDLFLVVILPSPRDLEIARILGWYRIPLKSAPKVIEADFLAFYQTSAFGDGHRWQIEFAARVRGHELTTRGQLLKDEPDHPRKNEEYFKLSLGEVFRLPKPIPAGSWKRVTFLYTTGGRVLAADVLADLVTRDQEREVLWHALRERALDHEKYEVKTDAGFDLDPAIMALIAGLEQVER